VASFMSEVFPMPVRRVGVNDIFGESGTAQELLDLHGLRAKNIVDKALTILESDGKAIA
jgi:transketolase